MKKKKGKRYLIYTIYILAIFVSVFLSIRFTYKNVIDEVISTVTYMVQGDTKYKVYYEKNNYYTDDYYNQATQEKFAGNLIDKIDVTYDYHVNFSDVVAGSIEYYIEAILYVENNLSKSYILSTKELESYRSNSKDINKTVMVDYKYFKDIYNNYVNEQGPSYAGNAFIKVYFKAINKVNYQSMDEIDEENNLGLIIPISNDPISISKDTNITSEEKTLTVKNDNSNLKMFYQAASLATWIITILLIISFSITYSKNIESDSTYKKRLAKILRDYDELIVNVRRLPNLDSYQTIEVTTFNELLDAQNNVEMPINFKEEKTSSKFVVIKDNLAWVYTLKEKK